MSQSKGNSRFSSREVFKSNDMTSEQSRSKIYGESFFEKVPSEDSMR